MSLIEVKNIGKVYQDEDLGTKALSEASFKIEKGEFVAIMGPSGSGKSTLLHILGFLDEPSYGEYFFDDQEMHDYNKEQAAKLRNRKMGFIFQSFNLLPRTTVIDNVKLPLLYSEIPEKKWQTLAEASLAKVGLSHRLNHEPNQLSGGERQRVAIARALVVEPEIIFADEPTGNLDSKSGENVMKILKSLNESSGQTIILITHDPEIADFANRIITIRDGRVESDFKKAHHL